MNTIIAALSAALGPDQVLTDAASLHARRFDRWCVNHLRDFRGETLPSCAVIARPANVADVQKIVRICTAMNTPIIPYGLGSGVCGGIVGNPRAVLLDMGSMNRVRSIDPINLLADFDAGINGLLAEQLVAVEGLTIGHWPQSIGISSVGGWVSTRASGQFSTAYGNIEDIIYAIEAVLPNGDLVTLGCAPRAAAGPDLRHLLMGAEGTMGVITGVTLSLRRAPEQRTFSAYYAKTMDQGFAAQREIVQTGWLPPVMRQYDHPEVTRNFRAHARDNQAMLLMVHEGPAARVQAELTAVAKIAADGGMAPADPQVVADWMDQRNHVPEWRDLIERGLIVDTVEISGTWSRIGAIYNAAIKELAGLENVVNASAHSSHVYRTGINLYFSFASLMDGTERMEAAYFDGWDRIMRATAANGGGIAHHHGAGRLRKAYLHHDLGDTGVALLRRLKTAMDPQNLFNPGNLIPDA